MARIDTSRSLPTGTVTLLFADVEGSTRLLHALGERFAPARARLREIVRERASSRDGHEVDWAGDGVFLTFPSAREAIAAATEIQRALAEEPWPPDEALRLRIGIHTGEPELVDDDYVGMDVVIAARICACAHGEQIVVSRSTRDLAGDKPFRDADYRPLGRHRLKDVPSTEELFQVLAPGLREEFPPLRTLGATTFPALHHRLVGRADALRRIGELISRPDVRLVTVTGPGGAGKSRLALEAAAAAALERPVHLVGLAPVSHPDLVPSAIARAIGVRESPARPLLESIADSLGGTRALLFLDNLEHLAPAASLVAELLDRVPDLDVLTTSRTSLRLSGEHVLPLEPLSPDDAATLFVELAAARGIFLRPDTLASVHAICHRLDGLPLAIELVAARLVVLPPAQILQALDDGLALEMEGPVDLPERQRTLRATIDWSYRLLTEEQRDLHGALAVFANGCSLEDAHAVAGGGPRFLPDLEALVGWSLLRSDVADGSIRLSMLETVREHAVARLELEHTLDDLRRRHAERFLQLAIASETALAGPEQATSLAQLERELENIRAALDWLLSAGRVEDALRATSALDRYWRAYAHVGEARRWLSLGLGLANDVPPEVRATALRTAAQQAAAQSDWEAAEPMLEEARVLYRDNGQAREEVLTLAHLSFVGMRQDEVVRAEQFAHEAVAIAADLGDDRASSAALMVLGDVYSTNGQHELAVSQYEEAVALRTRLGDPLLVTDAVYNLGLAAFHAEDLTRARRAFDDALVQARDLAEAPYVAAAQLMLAVLDVLGADQVVAATRARESLSIYSELEDDRSCARCLVVLAGAAVVEGSFETAARLVGAADSARGDAPPDEYEAPVLERYLPELEGSIGTEALRALEAEGRSLESGLLEREIASTDDGA
ncbi:MAG: adenylate/guanylate cyclase domain-containing protein [Actinomycetota bacterium]